MSPDEVEISITKTPGGYSVNLNGADSCQITNLLIALRIASYKTEADYDADALGTICSEYISANQDVINEC